jgi:hypothetical protein
MVEYINAVKLPFSDWKKLGIGALIGIAVSYIAILGFLAMFFISGYCARIAKAAMKKKLAMPDWDKPGELFSTGARICLIDVLYLILPTVLIIAGLASALAGIGIGLVQLISLTPEEMSAQVSSALGLGGTGIILVMVACFLFIITYYFLPMAIMNYIAKGKLSAAFNFGEILQRSMRWKYFSSVLFAMAFILVAAICSTILSGLTAETVIGPVIASGATIMVITSVTYCIFGQAYGEK